MQTGNFEELNRVFLLSKEKEARVLILDNNNLEFCCQHEDKFPFDVIFNSYDIVLVPEWVHVEISHSDRRLLYMASIPTPLLILNEKEDYPKIISYQEYRLLQLFGNAASSITKARRVFGELKTHYQKHSDLPLNWIEKFAENAFEVKKSTKVINGVQTEIELKKNAGETSILVLAYLLCHRFGNKIKHITIFSSDKGSLTIKQSIMDNLEKMELIHTSTVPISFKSTDILLMEAVKDGRITFSDIIRIRTNSKTVIYTHRLQDSSSYRREYVMDTPEFITVLSSIDEYHIEF